MKKHFLSRWLILIDPDGCKNSFGMHISHISIMKFPQNLSHTLGFVNRVSIFFSQFFMLSCSQNLYDYNFGRHHYEHGRPKKTATKISFPVCIFNEIIKIEIILWTLTDWARCHWRCWQCFLVRLLVAAAGHSVIVHWISDKSWFMAIWPLCLHTKH